MMDISVVIPLVCVVGAKGALEQQIMMKHMKGEG